MRFTFLILSSLMQYDCGSNDYYCSNYFDYRLYE